MRVAVHLVEHSPNKEKLLKILNSTYLSVKEKKDAACSILNDPNNKIDINAQDANGNTALHLICDDSKFLRELLYLGADVTIRNAKGETILFYLTDAVDFVLVCESAKKTCLFSFNYNKFINAQDSQGETALMRAIRKSKSFFLCETLVSCGADVNLRNRLGETALTIALQIEALEGHQATGMKVDFLLSHGADITIKDSDARTILMKCTGYQINTICKYARRTENFSNFINAQDLHGETALMKAIRNGDKLSIRQLLANDANTSYLDQQGRRIPISYYTQEVGKSEVYASGSYPPLISLEKEHIKERYK